MSRKNNAVFDSMTFKDGADISNVDDLTTKDDLTVGDDATVTGDLVVTGTSTLTGSVAMNGATNTLGDASTDKLTCTGRLVLRSVTDAGPMTATPGTQGEVVFNTSDSKFYGCTVTHGTAATWVNLSYTGA